MNRSKLRRQIAWEAARLMYDRQESEYYRAKIKAARRICQGWVKPADLPSNAEIRDEIQSFARLHEGEQRQQNLREMRLEALRMMKLLARFRPRLIGSVLTGHVRHGSDIDLHVFSDSIDAVTLVLEEELVVFDVERKRVRKQGEEHVYTHIHVQDRFPFELTVYPAEKLSYTFKSSITGKAIERASIAQLEQFLMAEYPDLAADDALEDAVESMVNSPDRFQVFEALLLPLENVKQSPKYHPEGDVLYHSLQVFDLARDELPYDEEFLLAALLHDIGKGIDPRDHVAAGLETLEGFLTERTAWLIEHHMVAHQVLDGTIGARAHRRLRENESYEDLLLLCECDRAGRQAGVEAPELDEALTYIRDLAHMFG
ncbi:MAG: HD domain-containing protein [Planctomycetales bacterium]|nr:HD domain-containing protein [Planctomycetales bacterium]